MDTSNRDQILHHTASPTVGDEVGEATGGIVGVVAGAAIGSAGGPIGTVIGGIAGALGGWWAGRAVSEATKHYTPEDDAFYREKYESTPNRLGDRSYEQVRAAYQVGHLAGRNPDYAGKSFEHVETDLRRGWDTGANTIGGEWNHVKDYAKDAYTRAAADRQNAGVAQNAGTTLDRDNSRTPTRADDVFDKVDPNRKPMTPEGPSATNGGTQQY